MKQLTEALLKAARALLTCATSVPRDEEGAEVRSAGVGASGSGWGRFSCPPGFPLAASVVISGSSALTERWSESEAIAPDWAPFPRRGWNRCRRPIAKTSYGGHGGAAPQH